MLHGGAVGQISPPHNRFSYPTRYNFAGIISPLPTQPHAKVSTCREANHANTLWIHSTLCAVAKALGKAGVKHEEADRILHTYGIEMPKATLSVQLGFRRNVAAWQRQGTSSASNAPEFPATVPARATIFRMITRSSPQTKRRAICSSSHQNAFDILRHRTGFASAIERHNEDRKEDYRWDRANPKMAGRDALLRPGSGYADDFQAPRLAERKVSPVTHAGMERPEVRNAAPPL